jgi:sulfonate transport system substrate-binding protein
MNASRRRLLATGSGLLLLSAARRARAGRPKELVLDWATYNPVSLVLREKGWVEEALRPLGVGVRWVQSLGSNKALEFLNAGSLHLGSTAGAAALLGRIHGNPIRSVYVFSKPEWTALVTRPDTGIGRVSDLVGRKVAATQGHRPLHLPAARPRAARARPQGRSARPPPARSGQGGARAGRRRCLGGPRPDDGADRARGR